MFIGNMERFLHFAEMFFMGVVKKMVRAGDPFIP
jgi:hypothetical protein